MLEPKRAVTIEGMKWKPSLVTILIAVAAALVVRNWIFTAYRVPTGSMQPALKPGDFIFSARWAYGIPLPFLTEKLSARAPERGDLVVFHYPQQPDVTYVKRVIGVAGDRLQIVNNRLVLNGRNLQYEALSDENDNPNPLLFELMLESDGEHQRRVIFQKGRTGQDFGPFVVPPGEVFLLGDNRDASDDSRYWGTVPVSQIHGRVGLIWLSLDWQNRWAAQRLPRIRAERLFTWAL